jgi:hypothetical protein
MEDKIEHKASMNDLLFKDSDTSVLKNLSVMAEQLKKLKLEMLLAEEKAVSAKKEYEYYASSVLPIEMYNAGVNDLTLQDGSRISVKSSYHCSPNKNVEDRAIQAEWLRAHGGDFLLKPKATVDGAQIGRLAEAGVPYTEVCDINTTQLKSFLKSKLGATAGSTAEIEPDDIPKSFHFQEISEVELTAAG